MQRREVKLELYRRELLKGRPDADPILRFRSAYVRPPVRERDGSP